MNRTIDKITLPERADWSVYESTSITFDNMAFGQAVDQITPAANDFLAFNSGLFESQVWFLADELGADIGRRGGGSGTGRVRPPDLRSSAARRHHRRATMDVVGSPSRRNARRDRGIVDGRRRVPRALATARAWLDPDDRRRPVHAGPLLRWPVSPARPRWQNMSHRPVSPPRCRSSTQCQRYVTRPRDSQP